MSTESSFSLSAFASEFGKTGGARTYLFYYKPEIMNSTLDNLPTYLTKSTTLPESNTEEIIMNWMGMDKKVAGKTTYADWTVTLMVDNDWQIRLEFEEWSKIINNVKGVSSYGYPKDYTSTQTLETLNYDGTKTGVIVKLINAWPKSIGAVTLDYSSQEVAMFDVTFAFDYYAMEKGTVYTVLPTKE